jgi:hypothetical protein
MAFDVKTAKERLAITDDTRDALIKTCLNTALAMAENYCARAFLFRRETARYVRNDYGTLLVRRYPIETVFAVRLPPDSREIDVATIDVKHESGMVYLGCGSGWGLAQRGTVELDYSGGYRELPADLEDALWRVFDQVWATTPGGGLPAGSTTAEAGAVRSFSIDGMSIGYDTSAQTGSGDTAGAASPNAWGAIPAWAIATLDFYRAESVIGGA